MTRLIDADELKKALKSNCKPELCHDINTAWCERCCRTNDFEDLIDEAPTVEEEDRPHGEWIKEDKPWGGFGDRVLVNTCPFCKKSFVYHGNNPKFCSECGADMREADV